ncbi:YkgJ family cysteine cluster protein [Thalassotalea crassostreae]|uniref:YkgJ family cysteine cluster protein n=1 Tax=Thalassotalea crassostreae TaxID=1763536 RepID=UPI0008385955|nr:YkgJ family cysteine cluster protein [Thalassotalea crassostreae]
MQECNQCGKCCTKYGGGDLAVSTSEIELWELFQPEIFKFVKNKQIWFDPKTGNKLERCPFLQTEAKANELAATKYTCSIYLDRPEDCRHYPSRIDEMLKDECEMLEQQDLKNPKQAQRKLDVLMIDSRPASLS